MPTRKSRPIKLASQNNSELSYDGKMIIVVLLLLLFYPLGIVFMWVWMVWPTWVKFVITLPVFLFFLLIVTFFSFFITALSRGVFPNNGYHMRYYRPMMQPTPVISGTTTSPSVSQYRYY